MSTNPYGDPSASKGGGGSKVLMGIGIGCGLVVLLCCGVGGIFAWRTYSWGANMFSDDPAVIAEVSSSIADLDIPAEFSPKISMNMKIPFTEYSMLMAMYGHDSDEHSALILMQTDMPGQSSEQMVAQMEGQMAQQGEKQASVQVQETTTEEVTIKGEPRNFTFGKGTVEGSEAQYWQVSGGFTGKKGEAIIMMVVPADDYTKEELIAVIESIR